jgi:hypothetical protein
MHGLRSAIGAGMTGIDPRKPQAAYLRPTSKFKASLGADLSAHAHPT